MICEICDSYLSVNQIGEDRYVEQCRNCIKTAYRDGVRTGFQLAGGDPSKLDAIYDKED